MIVKEYDPISLILYCVIALIGTVCLYYGHKVNDNSFSIPSKQSRKSKINKYYFIWFVVWLIFAVFRYIKPEIGGQDAYNYVDYFETCLQSESNFYSYRAEPFFRFLTQLMRFVFVDYHFYFAVVYGTIVYGIIKFLDAFYIKKMSVFPTIVATYVYIYSFNIMRSGWSIAVFLLACVWLKEEKYFKAIVAGIISVLLHTASIFYVPFILFYILIEEKKKIWTYKTMFLPSFAIMIAVERVSFIVLDMVRNGKFNVLFSKFGLGQPFDLYANAAYGENFWGDFFALNVSRFQIIPIVLLFIIYSPLKKLINKMSNDAQKSFRFLEVSFIYDLMMLPAVYYCHMWRSPEYFVFIRVIFWGLLVWLVKTRFKARNFNNKIIVAIVSCVASMAMFIYKINYAWDMSSLMPYYFEPFGMIIDALF